jgi:hypothetical protein
MCEEYEDERMQAFWRMIAERKDLVILPTETVGEPETVIVPLGTGPETSAKRNSRALLR